MTAITTDIDDLFNGTSNPSFTKDMQPGETREGVVLAAPTAVQAKKFQSTELDFWPNGDPKMQLRIELSTEYQLDADDQGDRTLFIKTWGGTSRAFTEAVHAAGGQKVSQVITPGTVLAVTYDGKKTVKSKNGSTFEENAYSYSITPGGTGTEQHQAPTAAPQVQQAPAPAAGTGQAPANPAEMIAAGWTDDQISTAVPGLTKDVIAWLRTQS